MMKIVFFIQNMERAGGSERVCSIIANYLDNHGYDITILSICGTNPSFFPLNKNIKQETLIPASEVDNKKQFISVFRSLFHFYKHNKVDLVIDVFPALSIYTILLKIIFHYKNISWEHYNYLNNIGMNRIGRKAAVRFSDYIITLTETDKDFYIKHNPRVRNKISSIFNPTPYPNVEINDKKDGSVLAIGRLERQKGFHHLIDVWKDVEKENNYSVLYIIGDGEEKEKLEEQIKENRLTRVVLTGKIFNVDQYYRKASVLVSTSEHEGLPMTMIEAQSFGVPIISFDYFTGPRDIITEGEDGYIITGHSQKEKNANMAIALIGLLSDNKKQQELSRESIKNSKRFLIDEIGKCWIQLIEKITK